VDVARKLFREILFGDKTVAHQLIVHLRILLNVAVMYPIQIILIVENSSKPHKRLPIGTSYGESLLNQVLVERLGWRPSGLELERHLLSVEITEREMVDVPLGAI
jgi:hypothetical protein